MMSMMRQPITMHEIPFAPLLSDTVPPVETPPASLPIKRPRAHRLVAWRHDGGMDNTTHETCEAAREALGLLHWAIYWKGAVMDGRDMVARVLLCAPTDNIVARNAWEAILELNQIGSVQL